MEMEDGFLANCEEAGMEVVRLSEEEAAAFKDAVSSVYDKCIETMGQERWDRLQAYLAEVG